MLLRAATAISLIHQAMAAWTNASSPTPLLFVVAGAAVLLLVGLWTPVAGVAAAVAELGLAVSHQGEPWAFVHFATMGAALAMLGPGAWSIDARLFGRKHIQIPNGKYH